MRYEEPQHVETVEGCSFYHTIDIPSIGEVQGDWDIRPVLKEYTGGHDFSGKRVMDVGTAGGILSFYAERNGADVVSFDQDDAHPTNSIPEWGFNTDYVKPQKRGYWLAHWLLQSKAKVFYGDIYALPEELWQFDFAIVGSILLHLEAPFTALRSISKIARNIVVTDVIRGDRLDFRPDFRHRPRDYATWWSLPPETISKMLQSLGYRTSEPVKFSATSHIHGTLPLYSITGTR